MNAALLMFNPDLKFRVYQRMAQWALRVIGSLSGARVTVIGEEKIPRDTPVLYVGNHRSFFDIILSYPHCPGPTGFIVKKEMEKIPLLNIWIRNVHSLFLDRTDIKQGLKTILAGIAQIKSGTSMKAKTEMFDYMSENGSAIINGDDETLCNIKEVRGRKPLRFGMSRKYSAIVIPV